MLVDSAGRAAGAGNEADGLPTAGWTGYDPQQHPAHDPTSMPNNSRPIVALLGAAGPEDWTARYFVPRALANRHSRHMNRSRWWRSSTNPFGLPVTAVAASSSISWRRGIAICLAVAMGATVAPDTATGRPVHCISTDAKANRPTPPTARRSGRSPACRPWRVQWSGRERRALGVRARRYERRMEILRIGL